MTKKLQRRPYLGVKMAPAGREFDADGLIVAGVLPNSIAELAGLAAGDVITEIGGHAIHSMASLRAAISAVREQPSTVIASRRGDHAASSQDIDVCRWPTETHDSSDVVYGQVDIGDKRLRLITTEPHGKGPHPAVVFIQGIRRGTVDLALSPNAPLRRLIDGLASRGIATVRLERRGIGDSEGGPFEELKFETEVNDVRAALGVVRTRAAIDKNRITLFGHSTGGMIAPLIAEQAASIVVYGTASSRWYECIRASARHQAELKGQSLEGIDALEADINAIAEGREPWLFGRCAAFHRQLESAGLGSAWSSITKPLLILHGEYDWVVDESNARAIEQLRSASESPTTYQKLAGLDHAMTWHASLAESVSSYGAGQFDDCLVDCLESWVRNGSLEL